MVGGGGALPSPFPRTPAELVRPCISLDFNRLTFDPVRHPFSSWFHMVCAVFALSLDSVTLFRLAPMVSKTEVRASTHRSRQ